MTVFMYTTNSADGRALDPSPDIATCHVLTHHPGLAPQRYQKQCFCRLLTTILQLQRILAQHAAHHRDRDAPHFAPRPKRATGLPLY